MPVPHGRPNGWASSTIISHTANATNEAGDLGGWQARRDRGRDGRAVARDGQLGGQVSHVPGGAMASREGLGPAAVLMVNVRVSWETVRHHAPDGLRPA